MADRVVEESLLPEPISEDSREAMSAIARRQFSMFVAHPWAVRLFTTPAAFGRNARRFAEQMRRITAQLALDEEEAWAMIGALNDYVFGYSLRAVSASASVAPAEAIPRDAVEQFPDLAALKNPCARGRLSSVSNSAWRSCSTGSQCGSGAKMRRRSRPARRAR